jgi:hypothetical protein
METLEKPFIPPLAPAPMLPLGRYLPQLAPGMVTSWLKENLPPGSLVLDPFGATPLVALEAAQAGYRVLVTCNNPILSLMLEVLAEAPPEGEFAAAISALAATRRGEERLELHIQNLYKTQCAACGAEIPAQAYLWQRDQPRPSAKIYHCPACGDDGERPLTHYDLDRLELIRTDAMHRARALARVVQDGQTEQRESVQEALKTYLPRPLYVLMTLLNKAEGLDLPAPRRKYLEALLISLCDEANTLWPWPSARPRPRQLTVPTQFREKNLWLALEQAVEVWTTEFPPINLVQWPDPPPETGGISLYQGRIKSLLPLADAFRPAAILTAVPRSNQAFWTLCALWSGWLWGREAVAPLRGALERRRYDWNWMAHALHSALSGPNKQLQAGTPFFAVANEMTPSFLLALFCAPNMAGFGLDGVALNPEEDIAQFWWISRKPVVAPSRQSPKTICQDAVRNHLSRRGEPASYLSLYAASLLGLAEAGLLPTQINELPPDYLARTQATLSEVLANRSFTLRYPGKSQSEEGGMWWLTGSPVTELPLADRVEREVVNQLLTQAEVRATELERQLNQLFPGLITPPSTLIQTCLQSYADPLPGEGGAWKIRPQELPSARCKELDGVAKLLSRVASSLNYTAKGEEPLVWLDENNKPVYLFYLLASSMISRFVFQPQPLPLNRCVLVLPGGRALLLSLKLERDPRLNSAVAAGWRIMKFRLLRDIARRPNLTLSLWEDLLDGDPPRWEEATQMSIFGQKNP